MADCECVQLSRGSIELNIVGGGDTCSGDLCGRAVGGELHVHAVPLHRGLLLLLLQTVHRQAARAQFGLHTGVELRTASAHRDGTRRRQIVAKLKAH